MQDCPIIYVRGYAGTQGEVEETVDDPFYGFNKGATHVRVGPQGKARFFAFESPLVRLMAEYGYRDVFEGDVQTLDSFAIRDPLRTIWIYRYYDITSTTFDGIAGSQRLTIEDAARGLKKLIEQVVEQCRCEKVNLVAHSMGGLICRSLIQKIYPEEGGGNKAHDVIDKLFTYGTPHGGIHFAVGGAVVEWIRDRIGWNNSNDFGRERMYQYLVPESMRTTVSEDDFDPRVLYGDFPVERVFCIVGTNAADYDVAMGMSKKSVGPQSDGLVQIESAYVKGASRAYIHRSHSGRYGMVNSEEGYQNLRRFLFGEVRVQAAINEISASVAGKTFLQAEASVALRGLPVLMHERTTSHYCPIILSNGDHQCKEGHHIYTFFLIPRETGRENEKTARYALRLAIFEFRKNDSFFDFSDHLEQTPLWNDHLLVDINVQHKGEEHVYSAEYRWNMEAKSPDAIKLDAAGKAAIALPDKAKAVLGENAYLCFEVMRWV